MDKLEMTAFGYCRSESKRFVVFIPTEIIKLIRLFYSHSSAFPTVFEYCGCLDVRNKISKPWKRRHFMVNNNFLLSATTSVSPKLNMVIPLEKVKIKCNADTCSFILSKRKHILFLRSLSDQQFVKWINAIQKASQFKITDVYRFLDILGISIHGSTVVTARHRKTNKFSAIKKLIKKKYHQKCIRKHIQILKTLDNPCIVSLYDLIETQKCLYFVMKACKGGTLFHEISHLTHLHNLTQHYCCNIMHQIAAGVKYMHSMGVFFKDLRPENILCLTPNCIDRIKICDLGLSVMYKEVETVHVAYNAPEILRDQLCDYRCDYWNIGIIMFLLITGYHPFLDTIGSKKKTKNVITNSILYDLFDEYFEHENYGHVSNETVAVLKGLLDKNANCRKTCDDILDIKWRIYTKAWSFGYVKERFKRGEIRGNRTYESVYVAPESGFRKRYTPIY